MDGVMDLNVPEDRVMQPANYPKPGKYEVRGKLYSIVMLLVGYIV